MKRVTLYVCLLLSILFFILTVMVSNATSSMEVLLIGRAFVVLIMFAICLISGGLAYNKKIKESHF